MRTKEDGFSVVEVLLLVVIVGIIGGAGFFVLKANKSIKNTNSKIVDSSNSTTKNTKATPQTSNAKDWTKPVSTQKGLPITQINDFKLYLLANKKVIALDKYKIISNGWESWKGGSSPLSSRDLFYTAFLSDTYDLWLLSNGSQQAAQITNSGNVRYITDWSKDSRKIVYYNSPQPLGSEDLSIESTPKQNIKTQEEDGFYMFNVDNGTTTSLPALKYVYGFIDNDRLLVHRDGGANKLLTYNTKTLEFSAITGTFLFGAGQFDFTSDGRSWTYSMSKNPMDDMQIVVGEFPKAASTTIDSGAWAVVQQPMFSPDNLKIAYMKREGEIATGIPNYTVWIYDINGKTKTKYATGQLERWVDSNTLLVRQTKSDGLTGVKLVLVNLATKQTTDVYTY